MDLTDIVQREAAQTKVEEFIEVEIRPYLHSDGGDCEVVELKPDGILRMMLHGACSTCPSATMTLAFGVERRLKEEFPDIVKGVELAGLAPYLGESCHNEEV